MALGRIPRRRRVRVRRPEIHHDELDRAPAQCGPAARIIPATPRHVYPSLRLEAAIIRVGVSAIAAERPTTCYRASKNRAIAVAPRSAAVDLGST
jgi:hypothetical protein